MVSRKVCVGDPEVNDSQSHFDKKGRSREIKGTTGEEIKSKKVEWRKILHSKIGLKRELAKKTLGEDESGGREGGGKKKYHGWKACMYPTTLDMRILKRRGVAI